MNRIVEYWPWTLGSLTVICAIAFGVWWYYDHRVYSGVVRSKEFVAAHITTSMVMVGRVMVPTTTHHPDRWYVTIEGLDKHGRDGQSGWNVTEALYDKTKLGDFLSFGDD